MFTWRQVYCWLRRTGRPLVLEQVPVENQKINLMKEKAICEDSIFQIDVVLTNDAVIYKRTDRKSTGKKPVYKGKFRGRTI